MQQNIQGQDCPSMSQNTQMPQQPMMPMQQGPMYQPMPAMQPQMPYGYPPQGYAMQPPTMNNMQMQQNMPINVSQNTSTNINIVTGRGSDNDILTCQMIMCQCRAPQFDCCQCLGGFCTAFCLGSGLETGACCGCYGCGKPDCCSVCCAGFCMNFTSVFIFGIVSSCIVGWKMMIGQK